MLYVFLRKASRILAILKLKELLSKETGREGGGGGSKYQNILATIDRVCWVGEGYLWIQDLTRNMLRHSGKHKIYPRDKLSATREADSSKS